VQKRDTSKTIKKGGEKKGPKKISLAGLRKEGKKAVAKPAKKAAKDAGKRQKKGDKKAKGGRVVRKGGKSKDSKKTAEGLDKDLENYWVKGGHADMGKYRQKLLSSNLNLHAASKRLDEDLDAYMKKDAAAPATGTPAAKAGEEKKE